MISYRNWKLLRESLGAIPLGLGRKHNLGVVRNEMGMPPMPMPKKKFPKPVDDEEMEDDDMEGGEEVEDEEDMGDEDMGDEGDEDMGDEEGSLDPDAEIEDVPMKKKKKPLPMGEPHKVGPFMKEDCGDSEDVDDDDDEEVDDDDKELSFLQKKQKKMKKKCNDGMGKKCAKCSKQKKESSDYGRPKDYDDSEEGFIQSMKNMYGNPYQRFSDGMRDFSEDLLLPSQPKPGEVGYAPQVRVGTDVNTMGETVSHLLKKIDELEKKLKK